MAYDPPEIIRTEDFIVANAVKNTYGDLLVTTTDGIPHKIGSKRERLFPVFQEGISVHVCYASFKGKEYIADAVQSDQVIKAAPTKMHGSIEEAAGAQQPKVDKKALEPQPASVKPAVETKYKADPAKTASIERQTALKEANQRAIALFNAGKFDKATTEATLKTAKEFEYYLNTGEIPDSALIKEAKKLGATEKEG